MVSRAVHHKDGGRERSGYADSRRDDPQPDGGGDGDTPVAQGGTFNVTLNTEGAERKEDLTAHNVKHVNVNFQPADEMKAAMQKADFVWLDKIMESGTASGSDNDGGSEDNEDTSENPLG